MGVEQRHGRVRRRGGGLGLGLVGALAAILALAPTAAGATTVTVGSVSMVSAGCNGQNAEIEQAVDPAAGAVYEAWMGCQGIGFARSLDGGRTFGPPVSLPGSAASNVNVWDPALAVAPDGTVYAAFMIARNSQWYPVVAASFDHGATFPQVTSLLPPNAKNWGDRDFIAVGPDGAVYVTWDYGPERTSVTFICTSGGSCAFATGDLNVVIQRSTDHGRSFGPIVPVSPGFPASGGDSAPLLVEANGRIDLLYQGYHITNTTTYAMDPANQYFTSSTDGGATWSTPVLVGTPDQTMSLSEWWIDGSLAMDAGGNLYATWDTQGATEDVGWLAYSQDHGRHWSAPIRATPDSDQAAHIMEVSGGAAGTAYVGTLTNAAPQGYALLLRPFAIGKGWLSDPVQVSPQFGDPSVWPGDTFGISTLAPGSLALSWGSGVVVNNQARSQVFATIATVTTR